ncbi:MAG TPA: acyl-CoA desaturase [Patescibacteria group bacterium]|nr:acyl-CoA desaturase [Patescibacteria group bacterium]
MADILQQTYTPKLSPSIAEMETARLQEYVLKNKLLDRDYKFYSLTIIGIYSAYALTLYSVAISTSYSVFVLLSIFFGIIATQIAGLMHDSSHLAMFKSQKTNHFFAGIFSATLGGNYRHWIDKHTQHHDHPNRIGSDSDLDVPFSFTTEHYLSQTGYMKWLRRYQAWVYLPMCGFLTYAMQFDQNFVQLHKHKFHPLDVLISCSSTFLWYVLPFLLFGFAKAIIFIPIASFITGIYMANIFATNHKGMPQLAKDTEISNLEQQIITTRNVSPGILTDFVYLCLNYQIEHHLYRQCPRNKLKLLVPYIKDFCRRTGIPYTIQTPWQTYKSIFTELSQTAKNGQKALKDK